MREWSEGKVDVMQWQRRPQQSPVVALIHSCCDLIAAMGPGLCVPSWNSHLVWALPLEGDNLGARQLHLH